MKTTRYIFAILPLVLLLCMSSCESSNEQPAQATPRDLYTDTARAPTAMPTAPSGPDTERGHPLQVPILAYHQIREWRATDTKNDKVYIISPEKFRAEIKMLHDSGFHPILPDQLLAYLQHGAPLPSRPVMISFDDATGPQYSIGMTELNKYGYKGVFFIMTVVLGHPDYMTRDEVKDISAQGHQVACHTWDHHPVTHYEEKDWVIQVQKPVAELQEITGKPVTYFAYPYGEWNTNAIAHLKKYGITAAFQLAEKQDKQEPLYTIRRIIADGNGDDIELLKEMKRDFKIVER